MTKAEGDRARHRHGGAFAAGPRRTERVSYGVALVIGIALVALVFPLWAVCGGAPVGAPTSPDFAQHVVGQRYFLAESWHWPLLVAQRLGAPAGTNIGLTDSLPLISLLLKPFAFLLPHDFQAITPWLAVSWLLQPVAAVFALRGAGEGRLAPAIAAALLAATLPSFLVRMPHAALSSHFTLLTMLGLYLRAVGSGGTPWRWTLLAAGLVAALLLIHPYLMMMASAFLLAIPLTLAMRGSRVWILTALIAVAALAGTAALAVGLGYAGSPANSGFGVDSMNLLSPVWPETSFFLHGFVPHLDATGGQYEGFQYLGAGLICLTATVLILSPGQAVRAAGRHGGLLAACAVLTALALSSRVYAGHVLLFSLPAPDFLGIIRASGRLFWPVSYTILISCAALLMKTAPRLGPYLLLGVAALQCADAGRLLSADRKHLHKTAAFPFDAALLRSTLADSRTLDIIPRFPCEATYAGISAMMDVIWLGSETDIVTNTVYTARTEPPYQCDIEEQAARPLQKGEVRVLLPGHASLAAVVPGGSSLCRPSGEFTFCTLAFHAPGAD